MFRASMVMGLAAGLVVALGVTGAGPGGSAALAQTPPDREKAQAARLAEEWAKSNPRGRTTAQERPVVKDNMHPRVSPKEREAMGLPAPTWVGVDGKVQKAVREALEEQRTLIASRDPMVEFQGDRPAGFQGTAYVDLYLRHDPKGKPKSKDNQAAIREVQKRILTKLTAAEFSLVFAFENTAGLVGYIDESGLRKLIHDPDVVAIGLDDQARPEDPPIALREPVPPVSHGERPPPTEMLGKVEAEVYKALEKSTQGAVYVIVVVGSVDWDSVGVEKGDAIATQRDSRVLSALAAEDFRCRGRGGSFFDGYVTATGLKKLDAHPDVRSVGLNEAVRFLGDVKQGKR